MEARKLPDAEKPRRDEPPSVLPRDPRCALQALYDEHIGFVRAVMARALGPGLDWEDQAQEVFLVAMRNPALLRGEIPARPWLAGVALKVAAGARRKARLRRFLGLEQAPESADTRTPATAFESVEAARLVYQALEGIAEKKRTVFILYELQEMSGQEIAEAVGCPLKTVWTRLFHARREFQERLALLGHGGKDAAEGGEKAGLSHG